MSDPAETEFRAAVLQELRAMNKNIRALTPPPRKPWKHAVFEAFERMGREQKGSAA
jgi:hypothetical protein